MRPIIRPVFSRRKFADLKEGKAISENTNLSPNEAVNQEFNNHVQSNTLIRRPRSENIKNSSGHKTTGQIYNEKDTQSRLDLKEADNVLDTVNFLNDNQKVAVAHGRGPMLVLAGPGTGKTATLAARFSHMVKIGVQPETILSITFTRGAAQQLKERLGEQSGLDGERLSVGTFHAIAALVIKHNPQKFPRLLNKKLANDDEIRKCIQEAIKGEVLLDEQDAQMRILAFKDMMLTPKQAIVSAARAKDKTKEVAWARAYGRYEDLMQIRGQYDFGDLIFAVVEGLSQNANIRHEINEKWQYLMVDEYQDINAAQEKMISLLLGPEHNLWVVGDDDQALYGWRQADVRLMLDFAKRHPGAKIIQLENNYRCPPTPLLMAQRLISKNKTRYPKKIKATREEAGPVIIHCAENTDLEGRWIAGEIAKLIKSGALPEEIAVLARTSSALGSAERALRRDNIPCKLIGAPSFWQHQAVRIGLGLIQNITRQSLQADTPPKWMNDKLEMMRRTRDFKPVCQMVCRFLDENPPKNLNQERKAAWRYEANELLLECLEANSAAELATRVRQGYRPIEHGVSLCTIHASKGLEWPNVFVAGLDEGTLPSHLAENIEEERRLAYVAITRTRKNLFLSYPIERLHRACKPSSFLAEMMAGLGNQNIRRI